MRCVWFGVRVLTCPCLCVCVLFVWFGMRALTCPSVCVCVCAVCGLVCVLSPALL